MNTDPLGWRSRGYLPHYDDGRKLQFIGYRLADALPTRAVQQLEERSLDDEQRRVEIERYLDAGHGSCLLREPGCAERVIENWQHFQGTRYELHAWIVMPNHVHIVIEPISGAPLADIIWSWKSYTSKAISRRCARAEGLKCHIWHRDYYDRFIRDECHYASVVEYIHNNPVKAGLVLRPEDWPWSSIHGTAGRWPASC